MGQFGGGPEIDLVFHRHVHARREDAVLWIDPAAGGREVYELGSIFNIDFASGFVSLDQNGDGHEDMIIVDNGLHIYEPACDRLVKYRTQTVLVPEPAFDLHAVDINGDGNIEIASVRQDDLVLIQSDSLFTGQLSFQQVVIPWGGWMVDSADLDGDGVPELIGTSSTDSALWVYALESGQLVHRHTLVAEPKDALYSFRIGDLDGDETVEIIVVDDAGNARVFDVDASGVPIPHSIFPAGDDITIELMDLNADTLPDLLTGNQVTEEILIYLNVGDLAFEFERAIPVGVWPYWIVARDIDNDGFMDLVFGRRELKIVWGEPGMHFSEPQVLGVLDGFPTSSPFFAESEPVDLTGDGLLDIPAAIAFGDESAIFWQSAPRQFERIPYSGYDHAAMTSADLDGDGRVELLALSAGNRGLDIVWAPPLPCPADLNNDCTINFFDASDFLTAFGLGQPTADLAEPLGVWDFFDVSAFLAAFAAGCP